MNDFILSSADQLYRCVFKIMWTKYVEEKQNKPARFNRLPEHVGVYGKSIYNWMIKHMFLVPVGSLHTLYKGSIDFCIKIVPFKFIFVSSRATGSSSTYFSLEILMSSFKWAPFLGGLTCIFSNDWTLMNGNTLGGWFDTSDFPADLCKKKQYSKCQNRRTCILYRARH